MRLSLVSLVCLLLAGYRTGLGLDVGFDDLSTLVFSGLTLFKRFSLMLFLMSKLVFELASALVKSFTRLSILFFFFFWIICVGCIRVSFSLNRFVFNFYFCEI